MVVLIVWLIAVGVAAVLAGSLGYGLYGQVRRLRRTVAAAAADLQPRLAALRPPAGSGRHRAD